MTYLRFYEHVASVSSSCQVHNNIWKIRPYLTQHATQFLLQGPAHGLDYQNAIQVGLCGSR